MRRAGAVHRGILPDPKYGSRLVAKFVNMMMYGGKKSTAEHIMYSALGSMEERAKQDALKLFKSAGENCKPAVEVKARRVGRPPLSGSGGGAPGSPGGAVDAVADRVRAAALGEEHGGQARRRAARRGQQSRRGGGEARRHSQDGGGQQGVRALSLVATGYAEGGRVLDPPLSL